MFMVMFVMINANRIGGTIAKKRTIFRVLTHGFRQARTTDMAIKAHHPVGFCHHQMQIMRNHQNRTALILADGLNQAIKLCLAGHIHALGWFIEHQQVRFAQKRTRQHHPLGFPARKIANLAVKHMAGPDMV